jgi:serine/threonine protein phosphatase PrpC
MPTTINQPHSPSNVFILKENLVGLEYNSYSSASESSKSGENQDRMRNRFVADGIGKYEDSQVHSEAAACIYDQVFGTNNTPLPKNVLEIKIKAFNLKIQNYCKENNLKKLKTTLVFAIPFIEDDVERFCLVSQGDSLVLGYTHKGKCEQLTLNSHPLFKNISEQNKPELTKCAIDIQQIIRDNAVIFSTDRHLCIQDSAQQIQQIQQIDNASEYENFIQSVIISSQDLLPETDKLKAMQQRLNDLLKNEQTSKIQKEIESIQKSLKLARALDLFVTTKDISYFIESYVLSMNVVSDFQTITYRDSSEFKYLLIASDGFSDNLDSKQTESILSLSSLDGNQKNQLLATEAKKANIKPDNISTILVSIKKK